MKANIKLIRIRFTTPLHISNARSDYGVSETVIHSDTLYSAIIEAWNSIGLTKLIPQNSTVNLPFTISSLFPYASTTNNKEIVYFLPRPASYNPEVPIELVKDVKKIEYIEAEYFKRLQNGGTINIDTNLIKKNLLTDKSIQVPLYTRSEVPRVKVPRSLGEDAQPFYTERIYFHENAGLYFFLQYSNDEILNAIKSALDYLKEEGIGTDRNVGNGKFNYEIEENASIIHFNNIPTEYSLNLSLFIPPDHETVKNILDEKTYFAFTTRGGWITTFPYLTLRKKYIRAIKEGSVLKLKNGISGKIVDITPDKNRLPINSQNIHPIFRVGQSIWVPFKI